MSNLGRLLDNEIKAMKNEASRLTHDPTLPHRNQEVNIRSVLMNRLGDLAEGVQSRSRPSGRILFVIIRSALSQDSHQKSSMSTLGLSLCNSRPLMIGLPAIREAG